MKNLDFIAEELFNKIRGRFPSITIGNDKGEVTNIPKEARFFDFDYVEGERSLGKISISLDEETVSVMYSNDFVENEDTITRQNWYEFLKELRQFSRKRLLNFDTRNITKSNLNKRDYKFLAQNRPGEDTMFESKMYGTSRTSYQDVGNARLAIKHSQPVNQMMPAGRTQHIESIYIESADGERFKYPFRHLNGARAMARHVSEGGKPFDDFGSHITSLSEELSKLKKFKTYMGRSSVMAEGLSGYLDAVHERIDVVKNTIRGLQREGFYKEAVASFEVPVMEDVPEDVAENWIDQLTIRQFNEELKDVFPYIYRLVSEHTKAKELGPDDLEEGNWDDFKAGAMQMGRAARNAILGSPEEAAAKKSFEDRMVKTIIKKTGDQTAAGRVYSSCQGEPLECLYSYMKEKNLSDPQIDAEAKKYGLKGTANMQVDSYDPELSKFQDFEDWAEDLEAGALASGDDAEEGNAYAHAVQMAKMQGKKKGDKIPHPNGDEEITLEKKIPVTEFVLSLYDRNTGTFPKGETAVLTAVEKDYGEQFIEPAKQFIERINQTFEQYQMAQSSPQQQFDPEFQRMKELAGLR